MDARKQHQSKKSPRKTGWDRRCGRRRFWEEPELLEILDLPSKIIKVTVIQTSGRCDNKMNRWKTLNTHYLCEFDPRIFETNPGSITTQNEKVKTIVQNEYT